MRAFSIWDDAKVIQVCDFVIWSDAKAIQVCDFVILADALPSWQILFRFGTMCKLSEARRWGNGLALGEEADFEALNWLLALNLIRSTKLHLSTEPANFL
jgi:hypothetical protein